MTASSCDSSGFTLVEVIMSMLILTVGLLGLLQSMQVAYEHNARNKVREAAMLLAEQQMNHFRLARSLDPVTTARKSIGGVSRDFTVIRESRQVGDSTRLRVAVHWGFRNISTEHEIYSIKKHPEAEP